MASNDRADNESLMALQALMQIRSNGQSEESKTDDASHSDGDGGSKADTSEQHASVNQNTNPTANLANLLRMGASPASLLQQAHMNYSPAQIAAIRAAAVASVHNSPPGSFNNRSLLAAALSPGLAAGPSQRHDFAMRQRPIFNALSREPSYSAASSQVMLPLSPALSPQQPAAPELTLARPSDPAGNVDDSKSPAETAEQKRIRKEEVEAALRSKPQRGRKRENLNAEERLELTRTRNREHAKSTR
jgi:hypothetical protein